MPLAVAVWQPQVARRGQCLWRLPFGSRKWRVAANGSRSAGRPGHRSAAEEVDVQVVDRLAAVSAVVHDQPVAIDGNPLAPREFRADREDLAHEIAILLPDLADR